METFYWIDKLVLVLLLFVISLGIAAYQTYFERKLAAWIQDRVGPDRAGPFGILQPIADGVKMFMKEDFAPSNADRWLFILGPGIAMFTSLITSAIIPWGPNLLLFGRQISLQVAEINIGILFAFGIISIGVYGIMIGGWASNNKYSLFGAIRASSQMISYELAMGISAITVIMISGSLDLRAIVESQHAMNWNIWYQPVAFIVFFICALAETNRAPFDLPECENELIGGYHTEYSSMKLGLFLFSEYVAMFVSSAIMAILFFGGYNFPGMDALTNSPNLLALIGVAVFFVKIFLLIFVFMWIRWTIPRFRFDQLMHLGWKVLIPIALVNMLVTGFVVAFYHNWF
ncbi:MAG: NADH-quinone oxidoreductase subunit NuoH [Bacteroidetes bacterium]|nr:NADH-quinone oxidoreductase subunit NuoH [Bacteroidota bacterium]MBM3424561.1 NADH-quinone oxidoreductase subunit NuoH [Bacteroidota bacterium]